MSKPDGELTDQTFSTSESSSQLPQTILRHFDLSSTPFTPDRIANICERRAVYPDGRLFIDRLLDMGGVDGSLYPPNSPANFRRLLSSIHTSALDRSKRDSFYYYLLRDYDLALPLGPQTNGDVFMDEQAAPRAETFASSRCLSKPWVAFMDAYWCLDNGVWDTALENLCDPIISDLNFFPQIVSTLAAHVSTPSRALSLVRHLVLTTEKASETSLEDNLKLLSFASSASLVEAFAFLRTFAPDRRTAMREELWCWMLGAPSKPSGGGPIRAQGPVIQQLAHLPLDQEEMNHLLDFLARPPRPIPSETLSLLHDLVTLRLVHQGQYAESLQLDRDSAGSAGKDTDRQRRREMVREFISILPDVQRRALAIEGDERAGRQAEERAKAGLVNGDAHHHTESLDAIDIDTDAPVAASGFASSTPVRSPFPASQVARGVPLPASASGFASSTPVRSPYPASQVAQGVPLPASPAPTSRPESPFTGPPRFAAAAQHSPALRQRILSGPFALPRSVSQTHTGSPAPRRPRQIIDDEVTADSTAVTSDARLAGRRAPEGASGAEESKETENGDDDDGHAVEEAETSTQAEQPVRRSKRIVSATHSQPPKSPPPSSALADPRADSPPAHRTRTRQASQTPSEPEPHVPGAFEPAPIESVPEDDVLDTTTAKSSKIGNGVPSTSGRARATRSVSRALLDDEDGHEDQTPKKRQRTRRAVQQDAVPTPTPGPKRSTRASSRASSALPSEIGSPTPSLARVDGRRRPATRAGSAQPTPRQTRSRKN